MSWPLTGAQNDIMNEKTIHKRFHKEAGEESITMGWAHDKNGRETVNKESGCAQSIGQEKGKTAAEKRDLAGLGKENKR